MSIKYTSLQAIFFQICLVSKAFLLQNFKGLAAPDDNKQVWKKLHMLVHLIDAFLTPPIILFIYFLSIVFLYILLYIRVDQKIIGKQK